jgi:hypothetical protein
LNLNPNDLSLNSSDRRSKRRNSKMSLGSKFLARKSKQTSQAIKTEISLANVGDGILPMLYTTNILKPRDEVLEIDFDWHNIKDDICPITIYVKGASKIKGG